MGSGDQKVLEIVAVLPFLAWVAVLVMAVYVSAWLIKRTRTSVQINKNDKKEEVRKKIDFLA